MNSRPVLFKKKPQPQSAQHFFFKGPKEFELPEKPSENNEQNLIDRKYDQDPNSPIKHREVPVIGKIIPSKT